jgi:hypothetical protein
MARKNHISKFPLKVEKKLSLSLYYGAIFVSNVVTKFHVIVLFVLLRSRQLLALAHDINGIQFLSLVTKKLT